MADRESTFKSLRDKLSDKWEGYQQGLSDIEEAGKERLRETALAIGEDPVKMEDIATKAMAMGEGSTGPGGFAATVAKKPGVAPKLVEGAERSFANLAEKLTSKERAEDLTSAVRRASQGSRIKGDIGSSVSSRIEDYAPTGEGARQRAELNLSESLKPKTPDISKMQTQAPYSDILDPSEMNVRTKAVYDQLLAMDPKIGIRDVDYKLLRSLKKFQNGEISLEDVTSIFNELRK